MTIELSVVVPSACRTDLLAWCLQSVTRHAPAGTQVLVVDDGSADEAVSRTAAVFSGVDVLRLPRRRGFCVAANQGVARARGAVVELLNDDAEVTRGWAEAALAHFADPSVGAVAPLVLFASSRAEPVPVIDSAGDRYYWGGVAGKRGHRQPLRAEFLSPSRVFGASASGAFYRRQLLERVGGFPEEFGAYFEDVDLSFRLNRAGAQVCYEPSSRIYHHVSGSYGPPGRRLLERQSLNEERVFWRNVPNPWSGSALLQHGLVLAAKVWRRWQNGNLCPYLLGRLQVVRDLAQIRRHRRWLHDQFPAANGSDWGVVTSFWAR